MNGQYDSKLYQNDYDGWKMDNLYLIYRDYTWYIGTIDLSPIYASCKSSSPYNPSECNNQWVLQGSTTRDTLKVWTSACDTVVIEPTSNPTHEPSTTSPTVTPTTIPTRFPSNNPSLSPSTNPTIYPSANPTASPSESNIVSTTSIQTSSTTVIIETTETLLIPSSAFNNPLPKDSGNDTDSLISDRNTFIILAGIVALGFICCIMACFGFVICFRLSKRKQPIKQNDDILDVQPRLRETIDEFMTQHLEENIGAYLHNLVKKKSSADQYDDDDETELTDDDNEGKQQAADPNYLYVDNKGGTTASYTQHCTPRDRRNTDDAKSATVISSGSTDTDKLINDHMDIRNKYHHDSESSVSSSDTEHGRANGVEHIYKKINIVIEEDYALDEAAEAFNHQIRQNHQRRLSRRSIGDQSTFSKVTDVSNQTEEKEDNLFYIHQQMKNNQSVIPSIEDAEGTQTQNRKQMTLTSPGYINDKRIKYLSISPNAMSPSPLPGPPNSERVSSVNSSNVISPTNDNEDHSLSIGQRKEVLDIDAYHFQITPMNKEISCKTFVTLYDEQKETELIDDDHLDLDDDDEGIDGFAESKTPDLSKLLFGQSYSAGGTSTLKNNSYNEVGQTLFHRKT